MSRTPKALKERPDDDHIDDRRDLRKIVIIGILTFSATIDTFDNSERSVFALFLVLLVFGNHLIPALTPFSRICLELISAVKQRHSALAEERCTREQGL